MGYRPLPFPMTDSQREIADRSCNGDATMPFRHMFALFLILTQTWGFADILGPGNAVRFQTMSEGRQPFTDSVFDPETFMQGPVYGYDNGPSDVGPEDNGKIPKVLFPLGEEPRVATIGVNPATLVPEALDLEIFPSFPVSDELSLKPSLSYSPDSTLTRRGLVSYGPPKQWRNHYGELVRLISTQAESHPETLGKLKAGQPNNFGERESIPIGLETYFINATGQEVNFFPEGTPQTWISDSGNYRLTLEGDGDFKLQAPTGLTFFFEAYKTYINGLAEILSLHYRTSRIEDRLGNEIRIGYKDPDGIQPEWVRSYFTGQWPNAFQEIRYEYESGSNRLTAIYVPKPKLTDPENPVEAVSVDMTVPANRLAYRFYYPDTPSNSQPFTGADLHNSGLAGTAEADMTKLALDPLVFDVVNGQDVLEIDGFVKGDVSGQSARIYLDLTRLKGRSLGTVTDLSTLNDPDLLLLESGTYFVKVTIGGSSYFYRLNHGKPNFRAGDTDAGPLLYRHQLDQVVGGYPTGASPVNFPDLMKVESAGSPTPPLEGVCQVSLYPALKPGDTFIDENNLRYTLTKPAFDALVDPTEIETGMNFGNQVVLLRADNLNRIAAIDFPASDSAAPYTRQTLVLTYDDWTHNHQEIKKTATYDKGLLLSETEYSYEIVRSLGTHEDRMERSFSGFGLGDEGRYCHRLAPYDRGNGGNQTRVGFDVGSREQEQCILRASTQRFASYPGGPLSEDELTTSFGGSYHVVLAAAREAYEMIGPNNFDPAPSNCRRVQWALDGKLFNFTWQINPDGSGHVNDLSPVGLDLDPFLQYQGRRAQVFKTYRFDTGFKQAFQTAFPRDHDGTPYFARLPFYPPSGQPGSPLKVHELEERRDEYYNAGDKPPTQEDLFDLDSTCYSAEVTGFEPVARYPYQLNSHYLKRESVRALHGSAKGIPGTVIQNGHFRTSAIRLLQAGAMRFSFTQQPIPNPVDPDTVARFLDGEMETAIDVTVDFDPEDPNSPTVTLQETLRWSKDPDDRTDLGSKLQPFNNALQIMSLQPSYQYQVRNLNGITWDGVKNAIQLFDPNNPNDTSQVEATRHSQAKFIVEVNNLAALDRGVVTLPINGPALGIQTGDVFLFRKHYYRVTTSNEDVEFEPGLKLYSDDNEPFRFYRYQEAAGHSDRYRGYDRFGNNGFQATYHGLDRTLWDDTSADGFLVPDFDAAVATRTTITDSTAPENQDLVDWTYFGRVKRQASHSSRQLYSFEGNAIPVMSSGPSSPWFLAIWTYGGPYSWLPDQHIQHYAGVPHATAPETNHDEDLITDFTYFPQWTAPYQQGKIQRQVTHKRGDPQSYSIRQFNYDARGRQKEEHRAQFKNGAAPYGTRVTYTRDGNTGLIAQERMEAGAATVNSSGDLNVAGTHLQQILFRGYDALSRERIQYARDGYETNPRIFGPKTHTNYISALETQVQTTTNGSPPLQLSLQVSYLDGLKRPLLSVSQLGSAAPFYATGTSYDSQGRIFRQYMEKEMGSGLPVINAANTVANLMTGAGFSENRYDVRGETAGVLIRDPTANPVWESYQWSLRRQEPASGNEVRFDFFEERGTEIDDNQVRVNFKQQLFNPYGELWMVTDFENLSSPALATVAQAEAHLDSLLDPNSGLLVAGSPGLTGKAHGVYQYDHLGNVHTAIVGFSPDTQTRRFVFDQRDRLRQESHEEMDLPVAYHQFEFNDQPERMVYGSDGRSEERTFDAYGNLTRTTYEESGKDTHVDIWTYTDDSDPFPGLVESAIAKRLGPGPLLPGVAYDYHYSDRTGQLETKSMVHNIPGTFNGIGYLPVNDLEGANRNVNQALVLALAYDDGLQNRPDTHLGRLIRKTFPRASASEPPGGAADLTFHYGERYGNFPEAVEDNSLGTYVFDQVEYGLGNRLTSFRYGLSGPTYKQEKVFDPIGRLAEQKFFIGTAAAAGSPTQRRTYQYDRAQRLFAVAVNGGEKGIYHYDSLGQIGRARIRAGTTDHNFSFRYDPFGNFTQRQHNSPSPTFGSSLADNRLNLPDFQYNENYGELTHGRNEADLFQLVYNTKGRLARFIQPDPGNPMVEENYVYDTYGMRVLVTHTEGSETEHRLYFYDGDNQAIAEWVHQDGSDRWDRTAIHFDGNTALTYSWDQSLASGQTQASVLPTSGQLPAPRLVLPDQDHPDLRWNQISGANGYDLDFAKVVDGRIEPVKTVPGIPNPFYKPTLSPGQYLVRIGVSGSNPGPWLPLPVPTPAINYHFEYGLQGWEPTNQVAPLNLANGSLQTTATGANPWMLSGPFAVVGDRAPFIKIRMKTSAGTQGQLFWRTSDPEGFLSFDRVVSFPLIADGEFHTYQLDMISHSWWQGKLITYLRLDPSDQSGAEIEIDFIKSGDQP